MNTKTAHRIKQILFASFFGALLLSYLQAKFQFTNLTPLQGYIEYASKPHWSADSWLDGDYQEKAESYINENIGFRPVFVRLHNQIKFSLFKETTAKEIVIGKEQYLYENKYIQAYLGRDFLGKDSIDRQVEKLRMIRDTLQARGILFGVIIAAGKASFFPEYIPHHFRPQEKTITNYEYLVEQFEKSGIQCIDFNDWFLNMKPDSPYPLYAKYGIHWSKYSLALVADSVLHFIENKKHLRLPELIVDSIEISDTARGIDYDMGAAMNLLYKLPGYSLAYPVVKTVSDSSTVKPAVIVIGDSYYSELASTLLSGNVFSPGQFWFYNKHIYLNGSREVSGTTGQIDPRAEIEKQDALFILSTEANLDRLGFGAIDMIYDAYYQPGQYDKRFAKRKERIEYWIRQIRNNPEWLQSVEEKAVQKNMDVEKMIRIDAEYMVNQEAS